MYADSSFQLRRGLRTELRKVCESVGHSWLLSYKRYPSKSDGETRELGWKLFWRIPDKNRQELSKIDGFKESSVESYLVAFIEDELLGIICDKLGNLEAGRTFTTG